MQFVIQNWYLFVTLVIIAYLLLSGPITRSLLGIKTLPVSQAVQLMNHASAVVVAPVHLATRSRLLNWMPMFWNAVAAGNAMVVRSAAI